MSRRALGVIGGSGLYRLAGLQGERREQVRTPFGDPSDAYVVGSLQGRPIAFLARHGAGHKVLPTDLNFRANICGFKQLGVERIVSVSAVGSMRDALHPLDVVLPDQFIDATRGRRSTFFGEGVVAHVGFADPVCAVLRGALSKAAATVPVTLHDGGTYLCIEGPQFSTRAESRLYRTWNVDVIGMTNAQEAKLAREAEICYATLAMVTDYDCWREEEAAVSVEEVVARLNENAANAMAIVGQVFDHLPADRSCPCATALQNALLTDRAQIPAAARERLKPIAGRYLE